MALTVRITLATVQRNGSDGDTALAGSREFGDELATHYRRRVELRAHQHQPPGEFAEVVTTPTACA